MDETMEILTNEREFFSSSPFEILSLRDAASPKPKLVKNLKEFWQISTGKTSTSRNHSNSTHSSESSTVSNIDKKSYSMDADLDTNYHQSVFSDPEEDEHEEEEEGEEDGDETLSTPKMDNFVFPKHSKSKKITKNSLNLLHKSSSLCSQNKQVSENPVVDNSETTRTSKLVVDEQKSNTNGNSTLVIPEQGVDFCIDSENDSGNCCSESYELDENSLEEPEFQDKSRPINKLPPASEFGGGNPFLMFLCLTLLLQHRDHIMRNQYDYNETAMYFDKLVRKHNLTRVLAYARTMHANFLKQSVPRV